MPNNTGNNDIQIFGADENNLKHIDVILPKEQLIVLAGVSGSGKSSLAFDTVAVESARQWQASYPLFLRNRMPQYERPAMDYILNLTPAIVVDQKGIGANSRSTVGTVTDIAPLIRLLFSRIGSPSAGGATAYSFNHPLGMCPDCSGLGQQMIVDENALFDSTKSINEGGIRFSQFHTGSWQGWLYRECPLLDADKPLHKYSDKEWEILRYGTSEPLKIPFISNKTGAQTDLDYEGVVTRFKRLYVNRDISKLKKAVQDELLSFIHSGSCETCGGTGLNPNARASKIDGCNISDYYGMEVSALLLMLQKITHPVGISIAGQIIDSIGHMVEVGLGYLSLSRRTDTLSGGEAQRLKMVRHLNSSLSNITYIFDEPTAGLHAHDAERIGSFLQSLRNKHNTVLVVEHSKDMLKIADHVIEIGPKAGSHGGKIVFTGSPQELKAADTLTAAFLREKISFNTNPLLWNDTFPIPHANLHNLKDVTVEIPRGVLTAVCGVAGSGKSTLICQEFASRYPDTLVIDQKPIGTSNRSTPATYTGIMDEIRKLFADENKVEASWFSANSKGACPVCKGKGKITPDVAFADPVAIVCEECGGHRFNKTALQYQFHGKNIEEVMSLTIEQAMDFFHSQRIKERLQSLFDVGLGYMTLGQSTSTLSGGEVQRLKIASELHSKGNVYVLDEPSTGLHHEDIKTLLKLLRQLVSHNNTVIIVEHWLELIAAADWVIELGPEGGNKGGELIFSGTPEELLKCKDSVTARYLAQAL